MDDAELGRAPSPIRVGKITNSEAVAIGPEAMAISTSGDVTIYQSPTYSPPNYRNDIAHLIIDRTEAFVGREREWDELVRFAGQEISGYLLVEAEAGYGKTALMAHLIERHQAGHWDQSPLPALLDFFIRQEKRDDTPVAFLRALNSQLLTLLNLPGGVPIDLDSLRGQFSQLWAQALTIASPDRPLLLLVDGLDEQDPGEVTIAHLLPTKPAPYVHIVVTSRPSPEPLQQTALEHPFRKASVLRLQTFGQAEVRKLLQEYGAAADSATIVAPRVLAMTKGEPLFARFVCQEVADEGEAALIRLEHNPPADVEDYFRQQFRQLDMRTEDDLIWEILGLLVVAFGGMTVEELAGILGKRKRTTRKAIEPIRRFLLGQTRFELMHLQFRKVVAEEFSRKEKDANRDKLLDWCRNYQVKQWPKETPDYILTHYTEHLAEAGEREALYALIDERWMNLKFERTYSHRAFAEDVERAISMAGAEEPPNLVQVVRGCLIYATLGTRVASVPVEILEELAQVGQVKRAQDYAGTGAERREAQPGLPVDRQGAGEAGRDGRCPARLGASRQGGDDDWRQ